jgi:hypothetical protein
VLAEGVFRSTVAQFLGVTSVLAGVTIESGLLLKHALYSLIRRSSIPGPSVSRRFVSFLSLLLGSLG